MIYVLEDHCSSTENTHLPQQRHLKYSQLDQKSTKTCVGNRT